MWTAGYYRAAWRAGGQVLRQIGAAKLAWFRAHSGQPLTRPTKTSGTRNGLRTRAKSAVGAAHRAIAAVRPAQQMPRRFCGAVVNFSILPAKLEEMCEQIPNARLCGRRRSERTDTC